MSLPFLRIPPFPGHRAPPLAQPRDNSGCASVAATVSAYEIGQALRKWRVGGSFWAPPASRYAGRDVILGATTPSRLLEVIALAERSGVLERAIIRTSFRQNSDLPHIPADSDPWDLCAAASLVIADSDDELALVAAISGRNLEVVGDGRFRALGQPQSLDGVLMSELDKAWCYRNPFNSNFISPVEAIELLGQWRDQITANRQIDALCGVAPWKRVTCDAMLWDGTSRVRYRDPVTLAKLPEVKNLRIMSWMARSDRAAMEKLRKMGASIGEIEDGMIRSKGLGANCVPPLSIIVDPSGPHFDPSRPSSLETILQEADIGPSLIARAEKLRETLVSAGITKYDQDAQGVTADKLPVDRRCVLVTGQVEDDRSVLLGGAGMDNLTLLRRARETESDAYIIYKPHPDVEAGHRKGRVTDRLALEFADEIDRSNSINALLAKVDAIHVLTSLAGFEALMRGCEVVTHGVPFYAGWGLTRDLGPVPARRSRNRSLDELVAATLILYPRYLDPMTRLPCPPEVLVDRMANSHAKVSSPLIWLREMQGRINNFLHLGALRWNM